MPHKPSRYFLLWFAWASLIVYGSLMPFEIRPHTLAEAINKFQHIPYLDLGVVSRADWIANILIYIPLSYLGMIWLSQLHWLPRVIALLISATLGIALATGVEFTQIFFAPRTVSINDLIAESIGTLLGLAIWSAGHSRLATLASAILRPGHSALTAGLTLYALAYLGLALFPYDFVLSASELQWKLLQGNYGWGFNSCGSIIRCGSQLLAEIIAALPLGLLLVRMLKPEQLQRTRVFFIAAAIGLSIEAGQFLVASGVSTFSASLAKIIGICLGIWLRQLPSPQLAQHHANKIRPVLLLALIPYLGLAALLNSWASASWGDMEILRNNLDSQRYLPLYYHYFTTETEAVASLIAQAAVYFPVGVGFWLWHASGATPLRRPPVFGLMLATIAIALGIETGKFFLANSHPDFTNVLIALSAAWLGQRLSQWLAECVRAPAAGIHKTNHSSSKSSELHIPRKALFGLGLAILLLGVMGLVMIQQNASSEAVVIAQVQREIPSPESLPAASLPGFRLQHPRLPAPSAADIIRLKNENPKYLAAKRKQARQGKLDAAILMAYIEPGSQNLEQIFEQLINLKFIWRGHKQGKLLTLGYDWLYPYWDKTQRQQLQDKLAHGCNYLIKTIRSGQFSPYNATLYGGPAQAMMACGIALYQDDPRGDAIMAFTSHMWKNRILPVWRQVMGKNGGWHEGAGATSNGIGQAIYQLPNMWRSATGEDYFKTDSGIGGFLDFLVYRSRPDGTQMRWGDSASFNRDAPDRRALALEFHHAAAYSLTPPPSKPIPTSWPWGPLSDNSLYDANAAARLPLSKHFDGIGLVIMRSDWGGDASYITFKAGDNYSSFSHLDQGSFTLYKAGPLAIDSGLFYKYGSDHHLNYAYQTIAHNVATITDPDEAAATANNAFNKSPRPIANDGGQRRIGGNMELYPHPLDINEWKAKRDLYHTGTIIEFSDQDDIVHITADITAAYNNKFSGEGTLTGRTKRVNRYLRSIIYDRVNDLFLVYDSIAKTDPTFTSRWLIHFQEQPLLPVDGQFLIAPAADNRSKYSSGILDGRVLLPSQAHITAIGGPGKEFWVDGKNYDNNGDIYKVLKRIGKRAEAGNWRIEISPVAASPTDHFLIAMSLSKDWSETTPSVRCSQGDGLTRCALKGRREVKFQITAEGLVTMAQSPRHSQY